MNKKKLLAPIGALALVGAIATGATLAFLSDQTGTLTNKFTFSDGINMDLHEDSVDATTHKIVTADAIHAGNQAGNTYSNILPKEVLPKDPTVVIKSNSEDCYVFVGVKNPSSSKLTLNIDTANWNLVETVGGVSYYVYAENNVPKVVSTNTTDTTLPPVFTTVTVGNVDTKAANGTTLAIEDIIVKASAVQSKVAGVDNYNEVKTEGLNLVKAGFTTNK